MFAMFKKVHAKERVVGWYSTGPKIRPADLDIHELFRRYTPNPVLVIINVKPTEIGLPTKAYLTVEEVSKDGTESKMAFQHIPSEVGAVEAEEVGVEHLNNVCEGKLPINQKIVGQLQDIFNLLPNLNVEEMIRSFAVKTNDMMMVIYLSSLIRSIIALHNLINNKQSLRAAEVGTKKVDKEEDKEKKGEKADSKEKEAKKTEEGANKKEKK